MIGFFWKDILLILGLLFILHGVTLMYATLKEMWDRTKAEMRFHGYNSVVFLKNAVYIVQSLFLF